VETNALFKGNLKVINVGVKHFADSLKAQGATTRQVNWRPPADRQLSAILRRIAGMADIRGRIETANEKVLQSLLTSEPFWVGMKPAREVVPGMKANYVLHSGPPIEWDRMCDTQRNGILGGILHEKLAGTKEEALALVQKGEVEYHSANDFGTVGAGVGITTASMPVNICRDLKSGEEGYCIPFEGRDGLGAWGVYNEAVEANLQVIEKVFAPTVDGVLAKSGGINIKSIIARGMQMNDETHSRQTAEGLMLISEMVPLLIKSDLDRETMIRCVDMLVNTERWFHPLGMSSAMAIMKAVKNVEHSTVVTAIVANGVNTGIKISALGDQWFVAPAPQLTGTYFSPKWGPEDAMPYLGDSSITEVAGMGGFAAAAAPAVLRLRGGSVKDAIQQSEEMKEICVGVNHNYPIPLLEFTGPPIGIDIRKVVETGIAPIIHGGIISKKGGQLGAGMARVPMEAFIASLNAYFRKYGLA
jgi:hypothetical protein